ncbi:hypothetical protein [Parasphingorhabdus pacifica]
MPSKTENSGSTARPANGGRACPLPESLVVPSGPFKTRRPQRKFASTGVVTADLLGRAFH